jgi:VWFA-related protein
MRSRPATLSTLLALGLLAPALAQQQRPAPVPQPAPPTQQQRPAPRQEPDDDDDDVVRITSNLVQLDVTVTDKSGRPVTDLRPEEFSIFEDGRAREITNFSFVSTEPEADAGRPAVVAEAKTDPLRRPAKNAPPTSVAPLHRRQVRRTIALIVDNLKMSHLSAGASRDGLRKFVNEQMRPGDLVGIYTTRGGSGALQQFTSDKAQLHRAIDRVRWYPPPFGGLGIDIHEPAVNNSTFKPVRPGSGGASRGQQSFESAEDKRAREFNEERNRDLVAYGALGTLRYIVHGMREAPGRKTAVLFSDGMPLVGRTGRQERTIEAIDRLVDSANRAGVVIYSVDTRGVFVPGMFTAADDPDVRDTGQIAAARLAAETAGDGGPNLLATETGGRYIRGTNNMDDALERVLREQSGYYLLGYRPSDETFKGGRNAFRDIKVKVSRSGVTVRSRKGFIAVTDDETRRTERGSDSELYSVLASPVNAGGVYVRLTTKVVGDPRGGAAARLLLHVDGKDLTFADDANGYKKLVLDVAAVTLGREGQIVDEFNRTHTVRTGGDILENIQRNGLTYTADVPVKKPGVYQLRIVVRDQGSLRVGSASQLIEVPDLSKRRLALSGLSLREAAAQGQTEPARATAETAIAAVNNPGDPAVRRFRPGAVLAYNYQVYNAAAAASGRPRLTAQARLFRNGQPVLTGNPETVELDPSRGWVEGALRLAAEAEPGEYILQLVVTDESVKGSDGRQATQWIDFEVVR